MGGAAWAGSCWACICWSSRGRSGLCCWKTIRISIGRRKKIVAGFASNETSVKVWHNVGINISFHFRSTSKDLLSRHTRGCDIQRGSEIGLSAHSTLRVTAPEIWRIKRLESRKERKRTPPLAEKLFIRTEGGWDVKRPDEYGEAAN
jgi:hypothetical protein